MAPSLLISEKIQEDVYAFLPESKRATTILSFIIEWANEIIDFSVSEKIWKNESVSEEDDFEDVALASPTQNNNNNNHSYNHPNNNIFANNAGAKITDMKSEPSNLVKPGPAYSQHLTPHRSHEVSNSNYNYHNTNLSPTARAAYTRSNFANNNNVYQHGANPRQ